MPNGLSATRLLHAPLVGFAVLAEGPGLLRGALAVYVILLALTDVDDAGIFSDCSR